MPSSLREQMLADIDRMYDPVLGFAETVQGPLGPVLGVFDHEYLEADPGGSVMYQTRQAMLRTRAPDTIPQGETVVVRDREYRVAEVMPDGAGETRHRLALADPLQGLPDEPEDDDE